MLRIMNPQKSFLFAGCTYLQNSFAKWKYLLILNRTKILSFYFGTSRCLSHTFFFSFHLLLLFFLYLPIPLLVISHSLLETLFFAF